MEISATARQPESSSMLAPGFRFHPTDEELVRYYLRRKVCGKGFRFDAISDIDIYKVEPWDLPNFSKLRTRDLEWYFFSVLDKKYGNGSRTNRATEKGYWKTTGKDRAVYHKNQIVGMKKTLVYHSGRAPKGLRSNWVMHEYRLIDTELEKVGISQDGFVLCRIFQKSGSGPKNGEQYGAPFVEEEWENDELELFPKFETAETIDFDADIYLDGHDLQEILASNNFSEGSIPMNFSPEDCILGEEIVDSDNNSHKVSLNVDEQCSELHQLDEFNGESSKLLNSVPLNFSLPDPSETDSFTLDMLEEYLARSDASDDNFAFDPSLFFGSEDFTPEQMLPPPEEPKGGQEEATSPDEQLFNNHNVTALHDSDKLDSGTHESDLSSPYMKQASKMLGSFQAPPAFASELLSKDAAALSLNLLSQSSSSVHVTSGMIQIGDLPVDRYGRDESVGKNGNFNIVLSLGFSQGVDGSASVESSISILPGKNIGAISRSWFYFACFWVLIISIGIKVGTCICAK